MRILALIVERLIYTAGNTLSVGLSRGSLVEQHTSPDEMVPWFLASYQQCRDLCRISDTLIKKAHYHWKFLFGTDLTKPPVYRLTDSNDNSPLRLYGIRQPLRDPTIFTGWVYILDCKYNSLTISRQNGRVLYDGEIFFDTPPQRFPLLGEDDFLGAEAIVSEDIRQNVLLRYGFDFALRLHQEKNTDGQAQP